jgi:hypothetical protein
MKINKMKIYNINTAFTFGKHSEKTIIQVVHEDIGYINWCLINLDHFVISDEAIEEIKKIIPEFELSDLAEEIRNRKMYPFEAKNEEGYDTFDDDDYGSSGEKYGWYNGWSDDAIDDAFEGDPMNTWNVD